MDTSCEHAINILSRHTLAQMNREQSIADLKEYGPRVYNSWNGRFCIVLLRVIDGVEEEIIHDLTDYEVNIRRTNSEEVRNSLNLSFSDSEYWWFISAIPKPWSSEEAIKAISITWDEACVLDASIDEYLEGKWPHSQS